MTKVNPEPPQNVRFVCADDSEIPLECYYEGLSSDGMHQWCVVAPEGVAMTPNMCLIVDVLPANEEYFSGEDYTEVFINTAEALLVLGVNSAELTWEELKGQS